MRCGRNRRQIVVGRSLDLQELVIGERSHAELLRRDLTHFVQRLVSRDLITELGVIQRQRIVLVLQGAEFVAEPGHFRGLHQIEDADHGQRDRGDDDHGHAVERDVLALLATAHRGDGTIRNNLSDDAFWAACLGAGGHAIRSATRRRALLLRELDRSSSTDGFTAFRVTSLSLALCPHTQMGVSGGQMQSVDSSRRIILTMRSSSEWNEITATLPPVASSSIAAFRPDRSASSSPFTAMRKAWNVLVAG